MREQRSIFIFLSFITEHLGTKTHNFPVSHWKRVDFKGTIMKFAAGESSQKMSWGEAFHVHNPVSNFSPVSSCTYCVHVGDGKIWWGFME